MTYLLERDKRGKGKKRLPTCVYCQTVRIGMALRKKYDVGVDSTRFSGPRQEPLLLGEKGIKYRKK
jgi:hypothetical protein